MPISTFEGAYDKKPLGASDGKRKFFQIVEGISLTVIKMLRNCHKSIARVP